MLFCRKKRNELKVRYVHPIHTLEMKEPIDNIISQLNSAILIAQKMQVDNCEVERFKMYKRMLHETWLGVAEYYNEVNGVDLENYCDKIYFKTENNVIESKEPPLRTMANLYRLR